MAEKSPEGRIGKRRIGRNFLQDGRLFGVEAAVPVLDVQLLLGRQMDDEHQHARP